MNEYNEAGLPPTIPPPDWIHNVTCYSPVLLQDLEALENASLTVGSLVKGFMIIASTVAVIILNGLFLIILNKESYASTWIKPQPRIIFTAMALNDLSNGLLVLGVGLFPALWDCWPFGEILCQVQALLRGTFTQQASLTLIVFALERYLTSVHPLTFEGFCSTKTCSIALFACLIFSTTLYALIVVPPGGFHFNINGLLVCEPYFISNNVLALAACLFYFPTTMILMYCYGTIFHSDKVKVRYKKAVLTSLPFVRASGGSEENANKMAERILADKRISDGTSQSAAAISLLFIIVVTPWAVQQVITSCTRTIAPPTVDFLVSWIANSHCFLSPIIYWLLNEQFRSELHSFCWTKMNFLRFTKTWMVTQSSSSDFVNQSNYEDDTSTQEQHWGEILERTVSKQNLMMVNGSRTNGTAILTSNQTLPKRSAAAANSEFRSTLSLEVKSQNRIVVNVPNSPVLGPYLA